MKKGAQQATKTPITMPRIRVARRSLDSEIFCRSSHIFFTEIVCPGAVGVEELALVEGMLMIVFERQLIAVVVIAFEELSSGRLMLDTEAMLPVW